MKQVVATLLMTGFLAAPLFSQSTDATVSGEVLDSSGAPVPDTAVRPENINTGTVSNTTSNHAGVYLFPAFQPGTYRVIAERKGFRRYVYDDLVLAVGSQLTVNVTLRVGAAAEVIEVKASTEQLETTTTTVGTVITAQKLLELPLAGMPTT